MPRPPIVVDGQVVGTWKRSFKPARVIVALEPFRRLDEDEHAAVKAAAQRFAEFHSLAAEISW
jgi:hypothetical protein